MAGHKKVSGEISTVAVGFCLVIEETSNNASS